MIWLLQSGRNDSATEATVIYTFIQKLAYRCITPSTAAIQIPYHIHHKDEKIRNTWHMTGTVYQPTTLAMQ